MRQIRLPKSYVNQSRSLQRRLRFFTGNFSRLNSLPLNLSGQIFPFFLLLLFLFLVYNLFLIRRIDCKLDNTVCSSEITAKLEKHIGSNVLLVNQKQMRESLKNTLPVEGISIGFKMFNTLRVVMEGTSQPLTIDVYLVRDLPITTMDSDNGSTLSANWPRPASEIEAFTKTASSSSFTLWNNGLMNPSASGESKIKYIFTEKPNTETIKSIFKLIKLVYKYLDVQLIQIVGHRVFLSQPDRPDIIVNVPFDESEVAEALKSYDYLLNIKKDAKVIDLRFKNPIIR